MSELSVQSLTVPSQAKENSRTPCHLLLRRSGVTVPIDARYAEVGWVGRQTTGRLGTGHTLAAGGLPRPVGPARPRRGGTRGRACDLAEERGARAGRGLVRLMPVGGACARRALSALMDATS